MIYFKIYYTQCCCPKLEATFDNSLWQDHQGYNQETHWFFNRLTL